METKEVAITQQAAVPMTQENVMQELGVDIKDLVIPKILLMQGTSEMVGDGAAVLGDVINSLTSEKLGGFASKVEIIPLKAYKTWTIYDVSSKNPQYLRTEPLNEHNAGLPWDDTENGKAIRRDNTLNYFVLLRKEAASGEAFPCVLSLKRTSYQAGKTLATHLVKMRMFGKMPYSRSFMLGVDKVKAETNTYGVFNITLGTDTNESEIAQAKTWLSVLATKEVAIDTKEEAPQAAPQAPTVIASAEKVVSSEADVY
jgi:hypothetical protein